MFSLNPAGKIPKEHRINWIQGLTFCMRRRVSVWVWGILTMYALAQGLVRMVDPDHFHLYERLPIWIVTGLGMAVVLTLNYRSKKLIHVKSVAYLCTVFLLAIFSYIALYKAQDGSMYSLATIMILILFFVSLVLPWGAGDVLVLTFLHLGTYAAYVFLALKTPRTEGLVPVDPLYMGDFVYITLAGLICLIIRFFENLRDRQNFILLKVIEDKNIQMESELTLASRVHKTLVPQSILNAKVDVAVTYLPVSGVGGDYGKFHFPDDDKMVFIISDVTGHGVPAALLVNRLHSEFMRLAEENPEPGVLLKRLNRFIIRDFEGTGMYLSAFCGYLDFKKGIFQYSNYGHPPQYLCRVKETGLILLESQTSLLGVDLGYQNEDHQSEITFDPGDRLVLFTDGVIETKNFLGQHYGQKRLEQFLTRNHALDGDAWNESLIADLNEFKFGDFDDDIFILNIHIRKQTASKSQSATPVTAVSH